MSEEGRTGHLWSVAGDNGLSGCTRGCGVYRLLYTGSASHQALYSRSPSLRDGTWGKRYLPCVDERPDHAR